MKNKREMLGEGEADWAMGEAFAFGSLLQDKVHVRLSGTVSTLKIHTLSTYAYMHTYIHWNLW